MRMLSAGDWVEVLPAAQIAATLDSDRAYERLPFMPEMLPSCGRRFRVLLRAERTCARGLKPGERPIRRLDGSVVLEGLRCDGSFHGGCQLGCMFFWKEAWLKRVDGSATSEREDPPGPAPRLSVHQEGNLAAYFCQGTELARATKTGDSPWDPRQYVRMLRDGTLTFRQFVKMYALIAARKIARLSFRRGLAAQRAPEPRDDALGLRPGEWVKVRSQAEILETLDSLGRHRGLAFQAHYQGFCGRTMRVLQRVDRILVEETGMLRSIRDTVILEGANCERYQGCARGMPPLWREAWLTRVDGPLRPPRDSTEAADAGPGDLCASPRGEVPR